MMLILLQIPEFTTVETLLVSIPESIGLLVFGIALVGLAMFLRTILSREDVAKGDENVTKKA